MAAEARADGSKTPGPVRGDHRARLLEGMATSVRAKGFKDTTLADVVREAGASRRTFYEYFDDPVDCYVALLESMSERLMAAIADAITADGPAEERLDRAVGAYLEALERDPRLMRSYFRELHLTGERGQRLLRQVNDRAGRTIHELAEQVRVSDPDMNVQPISVKTASMITAGIVQMAVLAQDEGKPLDDVRRTATDLLRRIATAPTG